MTPMLPPSAAALPSTSAPRRVSRRAALLLLGALAAHAHGRLHAFTFNVSSPTSDTQLAGDYDVINIVGAGSLTGGAHQVYGLNSRFNASTANAIVGGTVNLSGRYSAMFAYQSDAINGGTQNITGYAAIFAISSTGGIRAGTQHINGDYARIEARRTAAIDGGTVHLHNGTYDVQVADGTTSRASIVFESAAGTLSLGASTTIGTISSAVAGAGVITAPSPATLNVQTSSSPTFSGKITGAVHLRKSGSGTLTLSGLENTATGGYTVDAGTLALSAGGPVGVIRGTLTINSGGTVVTSAVNALGWQAGVKVNTLAINGGTLNHTAAGSHGFGIAYALDGATMTSNGGVNDATAASHFAVDGASSFHVGGATPSTLSGRLSLRGDGGFSTVAFTVADGARFNIAAGISSNSGSTLPGPVGIVKSGTGVLALTGANTYTGNTTVNGGLVEFNSASALGASNKVILNGGGLRWASGTSTDISARLNPLGANGATLDTNGNNVAFATALSGSGALTKSGAGTLALSAVNTHTGGTVVNSGVLALGGTPPTGVGVLRGALTINSGATVNTATTDALGSLDATKVNTVTIHGGTLNNTAAGNQGWGVAYTLDGGTLSSNGGVSSSTASSRFAFGGPAGANTSVNVIGTTTSTIAGRVDLRADNGNSNVNFTVASDSTLDVTAAIVSTSPGFTKLGAGTMILAGANTYAGPTIVSAGTLRVDGSAANSAFTVQSGATLGGSGSVGSLTVQSGGTLAPGNSPGLLTVNGNLTLDPGSFTTLEIAGPARGATDGHDALNISGVLNAGGTLSVSFIDGFVLSGPAIFDFFNFTSFGGGFAQVNLPTVAGHSWNTSQLSFNGTISLVASAIPEPATFATLAGALTLGFSASRRRRSARATAVE